MSIYTLVAILVFVLGASLGSFISVLIHRIRSNRKGIFFGKSECPQCGKKLKAKDLIPIFSFILLKGKCRYCGNTISLHYLALELLTSLAFLATYLRFPFISEDIGAEFFTIDYSNLIIFIFFVLYSVFFVAIFYYDILYEEIPDAFLFPLIGISLLGSLVMGTPDGISMLFGLLIALIFFGGQILISKGKWLGEGDMYFSISMALILGWQLLIMAIVISYTLGAIISLVLLAEKKEKLKSAVPFAPFLVLGTFITIFFGNDILNWYLSTLLI